MIRPTARLLALLALSALPSLAGAQTCLHFPDADPATGPTSTVPFGDTDPNDLQVANQVLLWKIPASSFQGRTPIRALAFASAGDRTRTFDQLQVRMGHTQMTGFDVRYPLNFTGFTQLVKQSGDWTWHTPADQWSFMGLDATFTADPSFGDLVIQVIVAGASSTGTGSAGMHSDPNEPSLHQTAWRFNPSRGVVTTGVPKMRLCSDASDLQVFGGGCAGSNGLVPQLGFTGTARVGQSMSIELTDGPQNGTAAILLMSRLNRLALLDLTGIGAPGCMIRTFFDQNLPIGGMSNGAISLPIALPNDPNLAGARVWMQWVPIDPQANALGITTSPLGTALFGS